MMERKRETILPLPPLPPCIYFPLQDYFSGLVIRLDSLLSYLIQKKKIDQKD